MSDENIIFNRHSFTDEGVARYFAVSADKGILLNFNKSADFCIVANITAIEIDKFGKFYVFAQFNIICYA